MIVGGCVAFGKDDVFKLVERNWPMHVSEIAHNLQTSEAGVELERLRQMILDCLNELEKEQKIVMKELGNLKVVWPAEIKKLIE